MDLWNEEDDFDDAFFQGVDATEAAALQQSNSVSNPINVTIEDDAGDASAHQTASRLYQETLENETILGQSRPDSAPRVLTSKVCHCECSGPKSEDSLGRSDGQLIPYRWRVGNISVRDDSPLTAGSTEERIGKGELAVNCRQGPGGALMVVNVVITAAQGVGSAMDIPREAITLFELDEDSSVLVQPSPTAHEASSSPPAARFLLRLGLGVGCSIAMSNLTLEGKQHHRPPHDVGDRSHRAGSTGLPSCAPRLDGQEDGVDAAAAVASTSPSASATATADAATGVGGGCTPTVLTVPLPQALSIATPERRQLMRTEFSMPSSPASAVVTPECHTKGREIGELPVQGGAPDPVIAKIARDFDNGGEGSRSSSRCYPSTTHHVSRNSKNHSSTSGCGVYETDVYDDANVSTCASSSVTPDVVDQGRSVPPDSLVGVVENPTREDKRHVSRRLSNGEHHASNALDGSPTQRDEKWDKIVGRNRGDGHGEHTRQDDGRIGDDLKGENGVSGSQKRARLIMPPKKEEVDIPDGEWRRPLVTSPPSRRRYPADRRRPKVRDSSRNGSRGLVVLHLDDHDNGDNAGDGNGSSDGEVFGVAGASRGLSIAVAHRTAVSGSDGNVDGAGGAIVVSHSIGNEDTGRGTDEAREGQNRNGLKERANKRPSEMARPEDHSSEGTAGKRRKLSLTPQPLSSPTTVMATPGRSRSKTDGVSSWLVLRRLIHERYRDSEEHCAAEQTAASASQRGWGTGGSKSKRGHDGWEGEVMSPGIRVFWRQEQAFAYADVICARLAPEDAARYKVLSLETSSTGRRKFLVCDFRRFEEIYPYTALPDHSLLRHLLPSPPTYPHPISLRPEGPHPPSREQPPPSPTLPAGDGVNDGDLGTVGGLQTDTTFWSPPVTTTPPLRTGTPTQLSEQLQQQQQQPAEPSSSCGGLTKAAAVMTPEIAVTSPRSFPLHHVYEIIREGSPCRMYFDLEFARGSNPGLDGDELVRAWINVVAGKLYQDFGISVGSSDFFDLDSSTPRKFSRHVIVHLPGDQLFQDNSHVGRFVNSLAADLESWRPTEGQSPPDPSSSSSVASADELSTEAVVSASDAVDSSDGRNSAQGEHHGDIPTAIAAPTGTKPKNSSISGCPRNGVLSTTKATSASGADGFCDSSGGSGALEKLWVKDGDGRTVLFADVSVYTRNRCFRLLGSSKFGKTATLRAAATNSRTIARMTWRGKSEALACASLSPPRELQHKQPQHQHLRDVARTLLHDSLVVPATTRSQDEQYLTVGGEGQHRYSRYGRNQTQNRPPERGATSFDKSDGSFSASWRGSERRARGGHGGGSGGGCDVDGDGNGWRVVGQGFGPSPFRAVDSFLRTLICQGGTRGELRQWSYTADEVSSLKAERDIEGSDDSGQSARPGSESRRPSPVVRKLTHQVANNRWCWNIGRAHKSNHVFLVTDLSKGEVRQHCHDQECRRSGYRSKPVRLPFGVAPSADDVEAIELELGLAAAIRESPADWAAIA